MNKQLASILLLFFITLTGFSGERIIAQRHGVFSETVPLPGKITLLLIKIKAGTFLMGSAENEMNRCADETLHQVTLTRDFWLGKYEVTQEQYLAVMGNNPSLDQKGGNIPVTGVTWQDARDFCEKLTKRERRAGRLPKGYVYDLPTEAQWEYAAKGGKSSRNYRFSGSNSCDEVAWYFENAGKASLDEKVWSRSLPEARAQLKSHGNTHHPVGVVPRQLRCRGQTTRRSAGKDCY